MLSREPARSHTVCSVRELCKMKDDSVAYVDLTIAFQDKAGVAVEGPAVRFWF